MGCAPATPILPVHPCVLLRGSILGPRLSSICRLGSPPGRHLFVLYQGSGGLRVASWRDPSWVSGRLLFHWLRLAVIVCLDYKLVTKVFNIAVGDVVLFGSPSMSECVEACHSRVLISYLVTRCYVLLEQSIRRLRSDRKKFRRRLVVVIAANGPLLAVQGGA